MARTIFHSDMLSLKEIAKKSGINYYQIYRRKIGHCKTPLTLNKRTKMANAIVDDIAPFFKDLGFDMTIRQRAA